MKIAQVEISGFRIYDDPKDATFDFRIQSGNVADFAALYAPNGFGKTSFYDAVECGVTKSINRFYIRNKELEKLADSQKRINEVPLIRNTNSEDERMTYVKVFFDTQEKPDEYSPGKKWNQKHDIVFSRPVIHPFQAVLLSQEWISMFLTEINGESRYEKFMEAPGLAAVNDYYKKLKFQQTVLKEEIEAFKSRITKLRKLIGNDENKNFVETANSTSKRLAETFDQSGLVEINLLTTQEEIFNVQNLVSARIISLDDETRIKTKLEDVTIARVGNDKFAGVSGYFTLKGRLVELAKTRDDVRSNIEKFDELDKSSNELEALNLQMTIRLESKKLLEQLKKVYPEYESVRKNLKVNLESKTEIEKSLKKLDSELENEKRAQIEAETNVKSATSELVRIKNAIDTIPDKIKDFEEISNQISLLKTFVQNEHKRVSDLQEKIASLNEEIQTIQNLIDNIELENFEVSSVAENKKLFSLGKKLIDNHNKSLSFRLQIEELDLKISEQQDLSSKLQEFVQAGLAIVNELQSPSCPLCEWDYVSFVELAERVSKNDALSSTLKELNARKNQVFQDAIALENETTKGKQILVDHYRNIFNSRVEMKNKLNKEIKVILNALSEKISEIGTLQGRKHELDVFFGGKDIVDYQMELEASFSIAKMNQDKASEELVKVKHRIGVVTNKKRNQKGEKSLLQNQINKLQQNEKYSAIITWQADTYPTTEIDLKLLTNERNATIEETKKIAARISVLKSSIKGLKKELVSYKLEELQQRKVEIETKIADLEIKSRIYADFLSEKFDLELAIVDQNTLNEKLKDFARKLTSELKENVTLIQEYKKLASLLENVTPYLQSEQAKHDLREEEKNLEFYLGTVTTNVETELERAKLYLQNKIKEFFLEDLITDLYGKIDPHPDFKKITFEADFNSASPRLDVFVSWDSSKNGKRLIPNLYFSTAQINILSLSIFLANALKSKKYDCIFIDDPIQSLDSINVLSTVDLLRSIIVNQKKQIILSTHDEQFFNLLQKKIPKDLFKSKFMELASFGKLKPDEEEV